jgi:hypothetical protein
MATMHADPHVASCAAGAPLRHLDLEVLRAALSRLLLQVLPPSVLAQDRTA